MYELIRYCFSEKASRYRQCDHPPLYSFQNTWVRKHTKSQGLIPSIILLYLPYMHRPLDSGICRHSVGMCWGLHWPQWSVTRLYIYLCLMPRSWAGRERCNVYWAISHGECQKSCLYIFRIQDARLLLLHEFIYLSCSLPSHSLSTSPPYHGLLYM